MVLSRHRHVISSFVAAAVTLAASAATASPAVVLVTSDGAGADKAAGLLHEVVRAYLANDARYEPTRVVFHLGDAEAERAQQDLARADALVSQARDAYESLDLDKGRDALSKALRRYAKNAAYLEDVEQVADALMLMGATYILMGEQKRGEDYLAQAVVIFSRVEPDPRVFNPTMREAFRQAKEKVARRGAGAISITSNPSYARVYVDGIFRGVAPMTVSNLVEGSHYVRLELDGYRPAGELVEVKPRREASVTGSLSAMRERDSLERTLDAARKAPEPPRADAPAPLVDLGGRLGVEQVLLASVRMDGDQVRVSLTQYDLRTNAHIKTAKTVFPHSTQLAVYQREVGRLLEEHFSPATLHVDTTSGSGGPVAEDANATDAYGTVMCLGVSCSTLESVILFGGGGLGLAMAGLGGVMWGLSKATYDEYLTVPQVDPRSKTLASRGRARALAGDIMVPVGTVILAASVITYFAWEPRGSAESTVQSLTGTAPRWDGGVAVVGGGGVAFLRGAW